MKRAILWSVSGAALLIGAAPPPVERLVAGDALIAVTVNGRPLKLRIEPGAPGLPLLAPARARALGLKGGGMLAFGVGYRIGSERFNGRTQSAKFGWAGGKPAGRRVGWLSREYTPVADGSIGPAGVPEPVVRFQLHAARRGEVSLTLPLDMEGGIGGALFGSWFLLEAMLSVGDTPLRVRFDPHHATTLVTASAALAIARAHGGTMTRETGRQEIAFGVERPYRVMALARPLVLGGIRLSRVGVRVTDEALAGRIPDEGAAAVVADPDEVVVTARSKHPRRGAIVLGADALAGCSSIVFDKPAGQVRLSCT